MKKGIELKSTTYQSVDRADDEVATGTPSKVSLKAVLITGVSVVVAVTGSMAWLTPKSKCGALKVYTSTSDGVSSLFDEPASSSDVYMQCSPLGATTSNNPVLQASNPSNLAASSTVTIDRKARKQTLLGFGGAFTEAAAQQFALLPKAAQQRVLDLYWGPNGIGYTLGRVPINSCDFSVASYNFDSTPNDWDLEHFDNEVSHDQVAMLPFLKQALGRAKASGLPDMKIFGSPWSPPEWLKAPTEKDGVKGVQTMTGSNTHHGLLASGQAKATWAKYLSKWVTAYEAQLDTKLWGVTVQNEPEFAAPWEACQYNATSEAAFVRDYLGPTLKADHPDLSIMAFDHNKDHLEAWTAAMFPSPNLVDGGEEGATSVTLDGEKVSLEGSGGYVDGMAFHWYAGGMDRLQDGTFGYHFLAKAHHMLEASQKAAATSEATTTAAASSEASSDATDASSTASTADTPFMLGTEGCNCPGTETAGTALSWLRSERYAHDILQDLNHYASGWVDWNLLLSAEGGPNHLGNLCDAPILATPSHDGITVQPYLFTIGHFSKFFVPGTQIVHSTIQADFTTAGSATTTEKAKKLLHGGPSKVVSGAALTTWPCDKSSRQRFYLPHAPEEEGSTTTTPGAWLGALQLADDETWGEAGASELNLKDHNSDAAVFPDTPRPDAPLKLCVSNANNAATGKPAQVLDCSAGEWVGQFAWPPGGSGQLRLQNPPPSEDPQPALCLGAVPAYSELMTHSGGGPVTLAPCASEEEDASLWAHQKWTYSKASQSVVSMAPLASGGGQCLTASWPFLQAVVGVTPKGATVAVVVNEASVAMDVKLAMEDGTSINAKLPRESIQTFVVENPNDPEAFI